MNTFDNDLEPCRDDGKWIVYGSALIVLLIGLGCMVIAL